MPINVRQKGQTGEREVANLMNQIIQDVMREMKFPEDQVLAAGNAVQRNQNQSAVGGNDLSNTFGLSIEVKRQENLSVNTWWKQCVTAANRNNEIPVLMYRQNRKAWNIRTLVWLSLPNGRQVQALAEFDIDTFKSWFHEWVKARLTDGHEVRI